METNGKGVEDMASEALETFLSGMETIPATFFAQHFQNLETFLSGMETASLPIKKYFSRLP